MESKLSIEEIEEKLKELWEDSDIRKKMTLATGKGGYINYQMAIMEKLNPDITQEELHAKRKHLEETIPEGFYHI